MEQLNLAEKLKSTFLYKAIIATIVVLLCLIFIICVCLVIASGSVHLESPFTVHIGRARFSGDQKNTSFLPMPIPSSTEPSVPQSSSYTSFLPMPIPSSTAPSVSQSSSYTTINKGLDRFTTTTQGSINADSTEGMPQQFTRIPILPAIGDKYESNEYEGSWDTQYPYIEQ